MVKMYSTEFSKEVPVSKVEQGTDGSCFLSEGSDFKIKNLVRQSCNCQKLRSF